ncbi:MAG TPA: HK97-gp10 family putative phage morphogenesis protein [Mycobacterium sp.]|nr:HK97-gp10 family putative phage morphogenesis protein [Mycobacterium sp.]
MATARITTTLVGFDEVRAAVKRVPDAARVVLADVIAKTTFAVRQRALVAAPRGETGRLRASLLSSSRGLSGRVEIRDPDVHYWRFLEYGTVKIAARPFVRPAAELETNDFTERVRQAGRRMEQAFVSHGGLL